MHVVEQAGGRASGAHAGEFLAHELDLTIHPLLDFAEQPLQVRDIHRLTLNKI